MQAERKPELPKLVKGLLFGKHSLNSGIPVFVPEFAAHISSRLSWRGTIAVNLSAVLVIEPNHRGGHKQRCFPQHATIYRLKDARIRCIFINRTPMAKMAKSQHDTIAFHGYKKYGSLMELSKTAFLAGTLFLDGYLSFKQAQPLKAFCRNFFLCKKYCSIDEAWEIPSIRENRRA